jgi:anti-sigma factor RsiW
LNKKTAHASLLGTKQPMNENTTLQEQLLLYVFDELPADRVGAFEHHLISDASLQEEHRVVSGLLNLLRADLQPSPSPAVSPAVLARLETLMLD